MARTPPSPTLVERFRRDLAALDGDAGAGRTIAVAVSGGPDSLALLLLTRAAFPGQISAATVDHGLRPESREEALHVARICERIGCPHTILAVEVTTGGEGVQAEARRARYAALGGWMAGQGISRLLTAHHEDDQAETLLMRLQRGSGVAGLAGVRPCRPFSEAGEARILRPLLGWRRAELAAIVRACGFDPVEDPSNSDEAFDRVRMRRRIAETSWLDVPAIARSAAALAQAEEALQFISAQLAAERVEEKDGALLLRPDGVPAELLRRLVLHCVRRVAPDAEPRGDQLTRLAESLCEGRTVTLAGVKCSGGPVFRFEPAPPRRQG